MFYRVVLQGRAAGDHDLAQVKRDFSRVTGLPENVTERLFAQAPQPLKERAELADAERIAATLRAIGAAVTVERDLLASLEAVDGGVQEILAPDHRGPPTIAPGSEPTQPVAPPTAAQRMRRRLRAYLPYIVGVPLAAVLVVVLAPYALEAYEALVPAPSAAPEPVRPRPVEAPAQPAPLNARFLHGPWRCTDQQTGLSVYWTFAADGSLTFHGDTYKEGAERVGDPDIPSGWKLVDGRLAFTFAQKSPVTYTVNDLNLSRLHYSDDRDLDIQCRRP